jgi:hypothetical protein
MEMMEQIQEDCPLTMYLAFEYLPINQQANILNAIDGVYKAIINAQRRSSREYMLWSLIRSREPYYYSGEDVLAPPLCIISAHTGESINFKFDLEKKIFPRIVPNGKDIDILVPKWTAAVALTGAVITGGLNGYSEYLDITDTQLNIEKTKLEIDRLKNENAPEHNEIQIHINKFYYEINQSNIMDVRINNVPIKSSGYGDKNA